VADRDAEVLVRLDGDAVERRRVRGFPRVEALAGDPVSEGAWIADRNRGRVLRIDAEGTIVHASLGFPSPSSIAVAPDGDEVWVADPSLGMVRMSRSGGDQIRTRGLTSPLSISVAFDPATS
jgi:sugar lactone lactonase YvrE